MKVSIISAAMVSLAATIIAMPHPSSPESDDNKLMTRNLPQDSSLERRTSSVQGDKAKPKEIEEKWWGGSAMPMPYRHRPGN
ncbi:uncharacterized protein MELLADRAFT_55107 [Melampsora larici-populina 98AG31]|uniref:Secreted protein n=1 Tax=Melampsora larici-populina (strain 98AG31 / pathotype 3-4-7) TaxID=747676 RepID=F4RB62_MELLP|nr:uncharacterized protein MELLADRAFT_55107 [Melampsora larici-populina 98AG31]EGG10023.1 secreted protein [Melampsora larici-populina 98AG31]